MKSYVYVIYRPNGVPCYVGKGTGDRWKRHDRRKSNEHLARIMALAGGTLRTDGTAGHIASEGFRQRRREIMQEAWADPEYREKQVAQRKTRKHSEATKEKMRARWQEPAIREARLAALKPYRGRPHTPEAIEKMKQRTCGPEQRARVGAATKARWAAMSEEEQKAYVARAQEARRRK